MLVVKISPANAGDVRHAGLIPRSGRSPGGGHGNPLQYSCLENPHGQRSLVGYSPWGHKESNTTEQISTHSLEAYINKEMSNKKKKLIKRTFDWNFSEVK